MWTYDQGLLDDCNNWDDSAGGYYLRLYQNDLTPDGSESVGSFTECDFSGYTPQQMSLFDGAGMVDEEAVNPMTNFNLYQAVAEIDPPQTVYGWFITQDSSLTTLIAAGRFDTAPFLITHTGDGISLKGALVVSRS